MTSPSHSQELTLASLFHDAHTPGGFINRPVENSLIATAYETARWAPTAFNSQPMRLVMANSESARAAVIDAASESNRERLRTASQVAIVAADLDFTSHLLELNPHWEEIPAFLSDGVRREMMATSQTWLQTGYLITALRAQRVDVGPMTGLNLQAITDGLLAATSLKAVAILAIGYADPGKARSRAPRLSTETAITWL
jgi:3-hydroxypropanoate dehydrogenase